MTGGVLTDTHGQSVQCDSTLMTLNSQTGALEARSQTSASSQGTTSLIRTAPAALTTHALNSKVPDLYLKDLKAFSVQIEGIVQLVQVTSFQRVPDPTAECGNHVLLNTTLGSFKLDATHLHHADGESEVTGSFSIKTNNRRKLEAKTITAFYDAGKNLALSCNSV